MRLHHLNCISTCPLGGRLMDGRSPLLARGQLACHCILAETSSGLVLIDTGFGLRDVRNPRSRLSAFFLALVDPQFREEMTAIRQIERLGFDPRDVQHIVLTHLDFDHAGGLDDFPHASVHMLAAEREDAARQRSWLDRQRYRPQQWNTQHNWRVYKPDAGESWFGFQRVQQLTGLGADIAMLPLVGHTFGHAGVALATQSGWLLQSGDAYFHELEMDPDDPSCPVGLRFYQWMMEKDRGARLRNQQRLRALKREQGPRVVICSGHDVAEFERLCGHSAHMPARVPGVLQPGSLS